jgi:uncharacterized protein YbjT (DUF2867 family)
MTMTIDANDGAVLVVGGTGKTGRRVVDRLRARGVPVLVGTRSANGAHFDWEDPGTWRSALLGARSAYITYFPDLAAPGAPAAIEAFAETAMDAGLERLVLLSGRGEEEAQASEQALAASGADWTVLRCSWFNQNFSEDFGLDFVLAGDILIPGGDMVEPFVDADDIADVVTEALTDPRHRGVRYELTGPRALSFAEVAAELTRATGRTIGYTAVPPEDYDSVLRAHDMPPELGEIFANVLDGRNAQPTDGVQRALGRPPRDFADYARETAATGVWKV